MFIMAFTYKVIEKKNKGPYAKTPKIAVARPKMISKVSTEDLANDIASRCSLHQADVRSMLTVLPVSIKHFLNIGVGVEVGDLGSFLLNMHAKSAPSIEEWTPDLIERAAIRYMPGPGLREWLRTVEFSNLNDLAQ